MAIGLTYLYSFLVGYLSGSILFAWVLTKIATGKDIRSLGDKNPGSANVARSVGKELGVAVTALDVFKVAFPIVIARYLNLGDTCFILISIGAVVGHILPLYFGFKGGKGLSCAIGSALAIIPYEVLISLPISILSLLSVKVTRKKFFSIFPQFWMVLAYFISFFFVHSLTIRIGLPIVAIASLLKKENRSTISYIVKTVGKFLKIK